MVKNGELEVGGKSCDPRDGQWALGSLTHFVLREDSNIIDDVRSTILLT